MYLSTGYTADRPAEVRYYPTVQDSDMAVQVFLGNSFHTLYMNVEEARQFARDLLAAIPVESEA